MTDEEFEQYCKEYSEWLDQYTLDPDVWWREFVNEIEDINI